MPDSISCSIFSGVDTEGPRVAKILALLILTVHFMYTRTVAGQLV